MTRPTTTARATSSSSTISSRRTSAPAAKRSPTSSTSRAGAPDAGSWKRPTPGSPQPWNPDPLVEERLQPPRSAPTRQRSHRLQESPESDTCYRPSGIGPKSGAESLTPIEYSILALVGHDGQTAYDLTLWASSGAWGLLGYSRSSLHEIPKRLEGKGHLRSEEVPAAKGGKRRLYRLTDKGIAAVRESGWPPRQGCPSLTRNSSSGL